MIARRPLILAVTILALGFAALNASPALAGGANQDGAGSTPQALPLLSAPQTATMTYSDLMRLAAAGQVSMIDIDEVTGRATVTLTNGKTDVVAVPHLDSQMASTLSSEGVEVTFGTVQGGGGSWWVPVAILGSIVLLVLIVVWRAKRTQRKATQMAAQTTEVAEAPAVRFVDVAGCDEAVEELRDTLDFLLAPERFERLGATMPAGIILHGPPGTGKTLLAKALAGEAGVPFHAMSGSDFVEMYVGVGAKRVRELFTKAKKSETGAVIFIDEIDAIGRRRGAAAQPGGNQEAENTLNALLVELDGFTGRKGVICIAATNRVDVLDPALLRPGRFGLQVQVDTPDEAGRRKILELYARDKPLAADVDLDALARYTAGSSGAQLADMMNQAAIMAARADRAEICDADLREGHLRVLAGPERVAQVVRPEERRLVAWHEAGHVLSAELLATQDKAQRVTIRPRGRAAGLAVYGQTDRALHSRRYFHEKMICILAGRAAEQLLVSEISSGAANDLHQANMLARKAVLELGFSERVGQIIGHGQGGEDMRLSEDTRRVVDEEVERLVADAYADALRLLEHERRQLDALAEALLERGQLERVDILLALGGELPQQNADPRPAPPRRRHLRIAPTPVVSLEQARPQGRLVAFAHWLEQRPRLQGRRRRAVS